MTTIYLAGPIAGRTYRQATEWRADVTRALFYTETEAVDFSTLDPMRGKADPGDGQPLLGMQGLGYSPAEIFTRDLIDVADSNIVLANLDGLSRGIGTLFEFGYAYALVIPVVVCNVPDWLVGHPFIAGNDALTICNTLDEAISEVKRLSRLSA